MTELPNFSSYSVDDLNRMKVKIDQEIERKKKAQKEEAVKAAEEAAKSFGFALSELLSDKPAKKAASKSKLPAKFRNPANEADTWTGRGRQPQWFKDALAAGKSPEDLEIAS